MCQHPFLFGEPRDASGAYLGEANPKYLVHASGKLKLLDRMLQRLRRDRHKVLIFSQMTEMLSILEDYLVTQGDRYCRLDGSTKVRHVRPLPSLPSLSSLPSPHRFRPALPHPPLTPSNPSPAQVLDRQAAIDSFNSDPSIFVFLLSTRAGGLGINLTAADTVILFDSDWNPHQDTQAQDRCHRYGQKRPVVAYRLLSAGSVEIDMMQKQISKKKLERITIHGGDYRKAGQRAGVTLTVERLRELLEDDVKSLARMTNGKARPEGGAAGLDDAQKMEISDAELDLITNRGLLFPSDESRCSSQQGALAFPAEGLFYDCLSADAQGGVFGAIE